MTKRPWASRTLWANVLVPILTAATGVELSGEEMAVWAR